MKPEEIIRDIAPYFGDNFVSLDDYQISVHDFPNKETVIVREKITENLSIRYVLSYVDGIFTEIHVFSRKR